MWRRLARHESSNVLPRQLCLSVEHNWFPPKMLQIRNLKQLEIEKIFPKIPYYSKHYLRNSKFQRASTAALFIRRT